MANDPKRLMGSKWTAVHPVDREKHFTVVGRRAPEGAQGRPVEVELEALLSRQRRWIDADALGDATRWRRGWQ